jgi:hypothetical protein
MFSAVGIAANLIIAICALGGVTASAAQPASLNAAPSATQPPGLFPGGILRTPITVPGLKPSERHFTINLSISGAPQPGMKPATMKIPPIVIADCQEASLDDTEQKTFTIATAANGSVPIKRDIWEGTKIDILLVAVDDNNVVVDIDARVQSTNGTPQNTSALSVHRATARVVEKIALGTTKTVAVDGGIFQFTVDAVPTAK